MVVKQIADRDILGEFASKFTELNDDVLFGEVWSRDDKLSLRDRLLITVIALISIGVIDSSFQYHLMTAKKKGITKTEIVEILTHVAFYIGWPKVWAAFKAAKDVWKEEMAGMNTKAEHERSMIFSIGEPNNDFVKYFKGQSCIAPLLTL